MTALQFGLTTAWVLLLSARILKMPTQNSISACLALKVCVMNGNLLYR